VARVIAVVGRDGRLHLADFEPRVLPHEHAHAGGREEDERGGDELRAPTGGRVCRPARVRESALAPVAAGVHVVHSVKIIRTPFDGKLAGAN
jgi:hypothetical protein